MNIATNVIAAGTVLSIGPAAAAANSPAVAPAATDLWQLGLQLDAELIAVCAEFDALQAQIEALYDGPSAIEDDDGAEAAARPLYQRQDALMDRMRDLRAATPIGIQAWAHALAAHAGHGNFSFDEPDGYAGQLLGFLMRDAVAVGRLRSIWTNIPASEAQAPKPSAPGMSPPDLLRSSTGSSAAGPKLPTFQDMKAGVTT